MNDVEKKISVHQNRMERLKNGEKIPCPFCHKGKMGTADKYIIKCDACGKTIIPRIKLNSNI